MDCEQLIDLVEATPAGPARPTGDKTLNKPHNTAGTAMQNQPARRTRSMTLSRYVRTGSSRESDSLQGGGDLHGLVEAQPAFDPDCAISHDVEQGVRGETSRVLD